MGDRTIGPGGHDKNFTYLSEPLLSIHCGINAMFSALEAIKMNEAQTLPSASADCTVGEAPNWVRRISDPKY